MTAPSEGARLVEELVEIGRKLAEMIESENAEILHGRVALLAADRMDKSRLADGFAERLVLLHRWLSPPRAQPVSEPQRDAIVQAANFFLMLSTQNQATAALPVAMAAPTPPQPGTAAAPAPAPSVAAALSDPALLLAAKKKDLDGKRIDELRAIGQRLQSASDRHLKLVKTANEVVQRLVQRIRTEVTSRATLSRTYDSRALTSDRKRAPRVGVGSVGPVAFHEVV